MTTSTSATARELIVAIDRDLEELLARIDHRIGRIDAALTTDGLMARWRRARDRIAAERHVRTVP